MNKRFPIYVAAVVIGWMLICELNDHYQAKRGQEVLQNLNDDFPAPLEVSVNTK